MKLKVCFLCLEKFHPGPNEVHSRHQFVSKNGEAKEYRICRLCWNATLLAWVDNGHSSNPSVPDVWSLTQALCQRAGNRRRNYQGLRKGSK